MPEFKELVKNLYTSKNRELTEDKLSYIESTYKGKEEDFVKNFYATVGEDLPEEKFNYIKDTYLKKKEPAIGLGYEKPSEALRMGGLPKQEKLSQSPLKTAATTTQLDFTRPQPRISAEEQQASEIAATKGYVGQETEGTQLDVILANQKVQNIPLEKQMTSKEMTEQLDRMIPSTQGAEATQAFESIFKKAGREEELQGIDEVDFKKFLSATGVSDKFINAKMEYDLSDKERYSLIQKYNQSRAEKAVQDLTITKARLTSNPAFEQYQQLQEQASSLQNEIGSMGIDENIAKVKSPEEIAQYNELVAQYNDISQQAKVFAQESGIEADLMDLNEFLGNRDFALLGSRLLIDKYPNLLKEKQLQEKADAEYEERRARFKKGDLSVLPTSAMYVGASAINALNRNFYNSLAALIDNFGKLNDNTYSLGDWASKGLTELANNQIITPRKEFSKSGYNIDGYIVTKDASGSISVYEKDFTPVKVDPRLAARFSDEYDKKESKGADKETMYDFFSLTPQLADQFVTMYSLVGGGRLAQVGLQSLTKRAISQNTGLTASSYLMSYEDYKNSAIERGLSETDAHLFASLSAMTTSLLEGISPNENIIPKGQAAKALEAFTASVGSPIKTRMKAVAEALVVEPTKEILQEITQLGGDIVVETAANAALGKDVFDASTDMDEIRNTAVLTFGTTALAQLPTSQMFSTKDKKEWWQWASKDVDKLIAQVQEDVQNGLYSEEKAQIIVEKAKAWAATQGKIPAGTEDVKRAQITPLLMEKVELLETSKDLDKVFQDKVKKRIDAIDKEIVGIMNKPISEFTTEIETTTDGEGTIKGTVSAGTDVAKEGLGMATEPGSEGVKGQGVQTEEVLEAPQAPVEALKDVESTAKALEDINTFDQQDAKAEVVVGKEKDRWGRSQVWRERIENAGDILRELSGRGKNPDIKYLQEKIDKIKDWILNGGGFNELPKNIKTLKDVDESNVRFSSAVDGKEYLDKFHNDVLQETIDAYKGIVVKTQEEQVVKDFILTLLQGDKSSIYSKLREVEDIVGKIKKQGELKSTPLNISEAYHKAKADGSNPELVKAVEELLGKPSLVEEVGDFKNVELKMRYPNRNEVIFVSPEKLLEQHAKDNPDFDVQKKENQIGNRVQKAKDFILNYLKDSRFINPKTKERTNTKVSFEPSVVSIGNNGKISFEDGRHRVLAAKELGIKEVPIEVPKEQANKIKLELSKEAAKVEPVKEATKPTKAERKAIAEAKIDDLAAKAKEFLRNKNLPEGTQVSGISQNKVIDLMASTVKALVNSGIEIAEAIKQVREFFEQDFDTSAVKDYEIAQAIARDELTDVAKDNGFSSYREAVFAVNKYVREVGKEDVITEDEIIKAKEAKDKEVSVPKKGYTPKKKKAQEEEKETVVKESGRSKSYEEGRVPVSEAYNEVVNAQKEYYEQMNQKATLAEAEEYLAQYGNSEQGLLDAYDDMMKAFRDNPFLDARNAIAIELLADRMFARALDFKKAGQSDKYNKFLEKSEDLRKEAFKAHYKAGQFNSAVAVFSRSVNPDAFLLFIDGQAKEGLENFKKTKPNVYAKYEQEVKDFQGKVKDIKKAAAQQAVISAPNSTTKVNVKLSDKLKARYEQGKARQAEALKKLGKINFFGSSGLSNEAIEAVGELVLAQFEQGIYKAATIIEKIIEVTEGKLTEKNIKDVYDVYKVNYKGEKRTLTELEEILRKEEIAEKQPATDTDKALEKEREKLAKIKADYEQAVVDRADALVLKRAQQFVKDQEKKVKEQEDKAKKAAIAKTSAGKRPTLSDLIQRELEADSTKEQIAKELVEKGGLSEREANKLAEIYYNKYRKILKEKIQAQLVKDLTPRKVKEIEEQMNALDGKPFGKTLGGLIANQVAAGALDSESLRAAFAAKYGIPNVSPIVAANIRSLSAKVRAAKTTLGVNLANKNLLTYINSTVKTKTGSIISTLYYTSILSGVSTAVVNTYGNVNNLINQSVENFVQSVIEAKQGNKGNLASNAQVTAKIRKAVSNLVESFTSFIDIMAYGGGESRYSTMKKGTFGGFESEDLILKKKDLKDLGLKKAFIALAKLYKTPAAFFVRNLPASDEGFYMSNFNMEATRELRKKLYSEGLRGEELEKQVYEQVYGAKDIKAQAINEAIKELKRIGIDPNNRKLLVNRIAKEIILKKLDETVQNAANELAKENTFRGQPRGATGYLSQKIPQLWLVTPFVSTPFKMAEKMINYIPLYGIARYYGGGITDTLRKIGSVDAEFKKKGVEYAKKEGELRNKQLAQVLTGHLLAMVFWGLSQIDWEDEDGKVVPFVDASAGYYGIEDKANREKLRESLPEYTMRVGNFKFSYKTNPLLAMIALPFGVIKDSERAYEEMDFVDWGAVYNKEILTFLYESTPIKGLQEFFKNIGETLDIEDEDRTLEDFARIPVKQAAALGANLAVDNIYKQIFDFYDPTKYVVQDNKEVIYKAMNMENIGGLQTDYDRWGREIKFYPGEAFFPIQYLFKDKTDKEITDWEIKNEITIPKINRKTLVLTDRKLKTEKAIEKQKEELMKDYGIESEEYKLFEETLNADFKLLTPSEFQAYDKTVRSEVLNIIKTNFDNVTEEYKKFYKESINSEERNIKPVSKLSRPDARDLVELLFKIKRKEYINKNFTKLEQE